MIPSLESIAGFALVLVRTSALVVSAPILGHGTQFSGYKVALIFAVALVIDLALGTPEVPAEPVLLGIMALREVLIGAFLGFLLQLVTVAVHVGGEMVGQEMGFMVARQVDPVTGVQTALTTNMYENLFLLALLSMSGHHWLLRSLGESFERAPLGELWLGAGLADTTARMFGEMFQAGIVFAAPVMVFLMLTSILIGLLARAVPHLNILEIGFTVRVGVAMGAMFLFTPLLEPVMTGLHGKFVGWLGTALDALGG